MLGGTLFVSKAEKLFPYYKKLFEQTYGYKDITFTCAGKDGLTMAINELKPHLLIMDSWFYQAGTPYMTGELLECFPELNIAAISFHDYPASLAAWFIWRGVRSYINLWDGEEEFRRGILAVREGEQYVSPLVLALIEQHHEWPDTKCKLTRRQMECLTLLCCGFVPERIGDELHISRKTVSNHLDSLYKTFHVKNREEMVAVAWGLQLVTTDDIRFIDRTLYSSTLPKWAETKKHSNIILLKNSA